LRPEARLSASGPGDPAVAALEAVGVEKWFGGHPAVRGIDLRLEPGQFLTVFGPNGAGKTTLLRLLSGALRPTRGEVRIGGEPMDRDDPDWRARIGVLSHQTFLYGQLTAAENLRLYGRLYEIPELPARMEEGLRRVGLWDRRDDRVRTFSRGMQQRLALARTLLHAPTIVLLDEPYTGLDPHAAAMLRDVLEHLRDGTRAVMMVTHNLSQGLDLADRVAVQVDGRWVSDEPRSAIDPSVFERIYTERVGGVV
jgi:heme exporter protein A